jgi:hypothetical protein
MISQAITSELKPAKSTRRKAKGYAEHRPSDVWGIASLPAHWREKPLKRLASINTDKLQDTTDPDYEIEYVDIGNVTLKAGIGSTQRFRFEVAPSRARRLVRNGDSIVSTVRTYLRAVAQIKGPPSNSSSQLDSQLSAPAPSLILATCIDSRRASLSLNESWPIRLA